MNDYRFTYIRPRREEPETALITERTEEKAREEFVKRFGGKDGFLLQNVELSAVDTNATKDQEREVLEKIKAMVAELGPQSYLKTAFDGVFEDAEQNIEFDAAFSMKARAENEAQLVRKLEEDLNHAKEHIAMLERALANAEAISRETNVRVEEIIQEDDKLKATNLQMSNLLDEAHSATGDAQRRAEEAEAQVVQLKAKLYDYMTAQQ